MNEIANKNLTSISKALRKQMTKEEKHLWYDFLKELPITVNRQKVIGNYVVDFYCASAKIVIELDGSQHYDEQAREKDKERDEYLRGLGIKVLRYLNYDFNRRFEGVCADILKHINTSPPPDGGASPQGEA